MLLAENSECNNYHHYRNHAQKDDQAHHVPLPGHYFKLSLLYDRKDRVDAELTVACIIEVRILHSRMDVGIGTVIILHSTEHLSQTIQGRRLLCSGNYIIHRRPCKIYHRTVILSQGLICSSYAGIDYGLVMLAYLVFCQKFMIEGQALAIIPMLDFALSLGKDIVIAVLRHDCHQ